MIILDGPLADWVPRDVGSAVTIGVLDGVHRGHRALISHLDGGHVPTVLTFDPHPIEVLRPGTPPRLITTIEERVRLLQSVGVSQVGILDLREIKDLEPAAFVIDVLKGKLNADRVVVGPDFRFGRDRTGDTALLQAMGGDLGYETRVVELIADENEIISSSRIRTMIEAGDVAGASRALDGRFTLTNTVMVGDHRGHELGFPTANMRPAERKVIPGTGVYAGFAAVRGDVHEAAVNVGVRPTFGGGELLIEAHLLDFEDDVYGEELSVEFVEYLRPELNFESVDDLVERMHEDVAVARRLLGSVSSNMS